MFSFNGVNIAKCRNLCFTTLFRQDVKKMYTAIDEKRKKADYERVQKDWKRMNLSELKELPGKSRYHYGKAIATYLGTSKGSMKAVHSLAQQLNQSSDDS